MNKSLIVNTSDLQFIIEQAEKRIEHLKKKEQYYSGRDYIRCAQCQKEREELQALANQVATLLLN